MLKKYYSAPICAFALLSFVSIAVGNIALALATILFLFYVHKNKLSLPKEMRGYFIAIGVFIASLLLSALFSGDLKTGLKTWIDMRIWRMMPLVIIIFSIKEISQTKNILLFSMIGIIVGIGCVIYQGLSGDDRAAGFFGHPMTFAGYFCIYLPLFLICFLDGKIFHKYNYLTGIAFFAGLVALLYNSTRGAWLALLLVIIFILLYYISRRSFIAMLCLTVIACAGIGLTSNAKFIKRVHSITSVKYQSNAERILIWQSAYQMFQDHPVLGVGLGQYKDSYQKKYISPKVKERTLGHAHNNFMQMLAENGFVGFVGFTWMIGYFICHSFRQFWKTKSPYAFMISMSTLALVLQGLTEYNFGNSAVMKAFWLVLGCLLVLDYNYKKE